MVKYIIVIIYGRGEMPTMGFLDNLLDVYKRQDIDLPWERTDKAEVLKQQALEA